MAKASLSTLGDDLDTTVPGLDEYIAHRTQARLDEVAPNPLNPRRTLGDVAELAASLSEMGQLQPCTVVTRAAHVHHYPEHEKDLGRATFVIVAGSRRRLAAQQAGLTTLDIVVKNEVAATRAGLAVAAVAENIDRENLDYLDEAEAVRRVVELAGSQRQAAKQLSRTQAWVSKRLALLKLSNEMQAELQAGTLPLEVAPTLATLPAAEQAAQWQAQQQEETEPSDNGRYQRVDATHAAQEGNSNEGSGRKRSNVPPEASRPRLWRADQEVSKFARAIRRIDDGGNVSRVDIAAAAMRRCLDDGERAQLVALLTQDEHNTPEAPAES